MGPVERATDLARDLYRYEDLQAQGEVEYDGVQLTSLVENVFDSIAEIAQAAGMSYEDLLGEATAIAFLEARNAPAKKTRRRRNH